MVRAYDAAVTPPWTRPAHRPAWRCVPAHL